MAVRFKTKGTGKAPVRAFGAHCFYLRRSAESGIGVPSARNRNLFFVAHIREKHGEIR